MHKLACFINHIQNIQPSDVQILESTHNASIVDWVSFFDEDVDIVEVHKFLMGLHNSILAHLRAN